MTSQSPYPCGVRAMKRGGSSGNTDASAVVNLSAYLYGPDGAAAAERLRPEWQSLLEELARDQAVVPTS